MHPRPSSKRPAYLVIALMLVWMVGLFGATQGCQTIEILRRPEAVRTAMNHITDIDVAKRQEVLLDSILAFRPTVAPLAVGQLLLGTLLTLTAGLTLLGRAQVRRFAMQAILAYSLFLPIDYVVRRPLRATVIEAMASELVLPQVEGVAAAELPDTRLLLWWLARGQLAGQLLVLVMGLFVITRPRVRAFLGAMASEGPHELEP